MSSLAQMSSFVCSSMIALKSHLSTLQSGSSQEKCMCRLPNKMRMRAIYLIANCAIKIGVYRLCLQSTCKNISSFILNVSLAVVSGFELLLII